MDAKPDDERAIDRAENGANQDRRGCRDDRPDARVAHQHGRDVRGQAQDRANRKVEVSADHQKRHANADDAQFRRDRHHADERQPGREQVRAQSGENEKQNDERGDRSRLGAQKKPPRRLAVDDAASRGRRSRARGLRPTGIYPISHETGGVQDRRLNENRRSRASRPDRCSTCRRPSGRSESSSLQPARI